MAIKWFLSWFFGWTYVMTQDSDGEVRLVRARFHPFINAWECQKVWGWVAMEPGGGIAKGSSYVKRWVHAFGPAPKWPE